MASVTVPSASAVATAPAGRRNYARIIEQTWIWSVVGYSLVRFGIAWGAFSEHGANAWIFGLIDVGTAWPYGKAVAMVCKRVAHGDWVRLPLPLVAAVGMFFAPYAYLWFAAGEMPPGIRLGLVICVSVLFCAASAGVLAKSRKMRRDERERVIDVRTPATAVVTIAGTDGAPGDVIDLREPLTGAELLIDLTGDTVAVERSSI